MCQKSASGKLLETKREEEDEWNKFWEYFYVEWNSLIRWQWKWFVFHCFSCFFCSLSKNGEWKIARQTNKHQKLFGSNYSMSKCEADFSTVKNGKLFGSVICEKDEYILPVDTRCWSFICKWCATQTASLHFGHQRNNLSRVRRYFAI